MAVKRVVIVGGGGAGDAAAFALRKKGFDGDVEIISADQNRPYDRPYLSKELLRGEVELPKVFLHAEDDYARERIEEVDCSISAISLPTELVMTLLRNAISAPTTRRIRRAATTSGGNGGDDG